MLITNASLPGQAGRKSWRTRGKQKRTAGRKSLKPSSLSSPSPSGRRNLCLRYRVIYQGVMTQLWLFMRRTAYGNRGTQGRQNLPRLVGCSGGGDRVVHE